MRFSFAAVALLLFLLSSVAAVVLALRGKPLPVLGRAPAFTAVDSAGRAFDSGALPPAVTVVNFFFTSCPHVCPMTMSKVAALAREFEGEDLRIVSISVDPERDTPARLTEYRRRIGAGSEHWHLVTVDPAELARIVRGVGLAGGPEPDAHNTRAVVVDAEGRIRDYVQLLEQDAVEVLARSVRSLL